MNRTHSIALAGWLVVACALPAAAQPACGPIAVDGSTIHACSTGQGDVTIVLAAGAGQHSGTWTAIRDEFAASARVVTFDRPGLGRSPAADGVRSPTVVARELRGVLEALGATTSTILVGHSMGGLHMLRYASTYPDGVIGVVLVDTPPPGFEETRMALLNPTEQAERRRALEEGATRAPPIVRQEREGAEDPREWSFPTFPADVPLTVIVADGQNFGTLGSPEAHRSAWVEGNDAWLALSDRSRRIVAGGLGHMVHREDPGLVVEAVLAMVRGHAGQDARR